MPEGTHPRCDAGLSTYDANTGEIDTDAEEQGTDQEIQVAGPQIDAVETYQDVLTEADDLTFQLDQPIAFEIAYDLDGMPIVIGVPLVDTMSGFEQPHAQTDFELQGLTEDPVGTTGSTRVANVSPQEAGVETGPAEQSASIPLQRLIEALVVNPEKFGMMPTKQPKPTSGARGHTGPAVPANVPKEQPLSIQPDTITRPDASEGPSIDPPTARP
ncbi:MAG: hypothetical protein QNJ09_01225 [Paracoccaceae bacterium]|nr:hypothetical protein [Paracoccaceae bacterium]